MRFWSKSRQPDPSASAQPGAPAAFFDLDKTLIAGSSAMAFAAAARRKGFVSRPQIALWGIDHLRYRLRGATDEETADVLKAGSEMLSRMSERDLKRMGPEVLSTVLPRVYPRMLEEIHAHHDAGRPTFIVSAASDDLVSLLARVLGMDGGIGTRYAVDASGRYTGELEGPFVYGEGKVEAMEAVAETLHLDLSESWAYSDSASDLPMLRAVGNPVVVNPDSRLAKVAREEGWRILRFERLGRRLAILGGALAAGVAGGVGQHLASRQTERELKAHERAKRLRYGKRRRGSFGRGGDSSIGERLRKRLSR